MSSIGIENRPGRRRRRRDPAAITATILPATTALTIGQTLQDTTDWATFLSVSNYSTSADGAVIDTVVVNYIGDTPDATTALADLDINQFSITVTDTGGNVRTFNTVPRTVVYAAPVAGFLTAVSQTQGTGQTVQVNVAAGFTGDALQYSVPSAAWYSLAGSTLTIDLDDVRSSAISVTATNSGGSAQVDLSVTIAPLLVTLTSPIANQALLQGGGDVTIDLRTVFDNATSYGVSGSASAVVDPDGFTLRLMDNDPVADVTINVSGTNDNNTVQSPFVLTVNPRLVTLATPVANQSFARNSGDVTIDLRTVFDNATSYGVSGSASVSIDGDGFTLRISDDAIVTDATITVTGSNANNSVQDQFSLTVAEIVETDFVMTFEGDSFTLPLRNAGVTSAVMNIDGGSDIPISSWNDPNLAQTGLGAGVHTLRLRGQAGGIFFAANGAEAAKVRTVENLGVLNYVSLFGAFQNCTGMTSFTAGNTDTSNCFNWFAAFAGCTNLATCNISGMSTAGSTNMQLTFVDCLALTAIDTSGWDTSNVIRMDECFWNCPSLDGTTLRIANFNLESLSATGGMFNFIARDIDPDDYAAFLQNIDQQTLEAGIFFAFNNTVPSGGAGGAGGLARARLINKGLFFTDGLTTVPDQMAAPALSAPSETEITVTLAAPPFNNGLPVGSQDLRYGTDLVNWTQQSAVADVETLSGLIPGQQYYVQTRARNFRGAGPWSPSGAITTLAASQPFAAARSGTDLVLTDVPDISPQSFTAQAQGADLVVTFSPPMADPAPRQLAVIDAANHDGTDPDTGSYDLEILDLGTGVNDVYTLAGAGVSAGAMAVLLDPRSDVVGGGLSAFERVVFIGASIMEQTFGSSLTQRNTVAEAAFAAEGAVVEVYAHATSGFDAGQVQTLLSEAMAAFPDEGTLFFVHAGGNNVSFNRPYPGGEAALTADLNGLIDIAAARPGSVLISDLTFRDYGDTTATNEAAGSRPYNDSIYLPTFQARASDLLTRAYYADGTPVSCLYEWSFENRAAYLSTDNVHPANPGGRVLLRNWLAERLAPICLGLPAPAQFVRAAPVQTVDIFVEYGTQTAAGVNTPAFEFLASSGQTADGPFVLLNRDGSDPGISLTLNFSAPAPGNSNGFGINTRGNGDGAAGFDDTLYNGVFTGDSYFAGSAYTLDHVLSGLLPDTAYQVTLVASRDANDSRETRYDFAHGETAMIQTTADPTQTPVVVNTVSDGTGTITITQSAVSGNWSYLGGLRITTP